MPTQHASATRIDPERMAAMTTEFYATAARNPRKSQLLASANTVVHVHYADGVGVTLRLDRNPIEVEPRIAGTAEVELWGSPELFMQFIRREKQMAMSIARGELRYRGPVRKFLRIVPILRSLDFSMWRGA